MEPQSRIFEIGLSQQNREEQASLIASFELFFFFDKQVISRQLSSQFSLDPCQSKLSKTVLFQVVNNDRWNTETGNDIIKRQE